jgi:DNA repair exonuclease SbcCD ATPase subunit
MKHWGKKTLVASLLTLPLMTGVAFADDTATQSQTSSQTQSQTQTQTQTQTPTDPFTAKYQQNLALENQLLTEAQKSNVSNDEITQLKQAIDTINQQISTLYQARQTLVDQRSVLRKISEAHLAPIEKQLAALNKQRTTLRKESEDAWKLVSKYLHKKHHNRRDEQNLKTDLASYKAVQKQLADVNAKIAKLKAEESKWVIAPYDGGVAALDETILKLQQSAIHYTKMLIALETAAQTSGTTSSSTQTSGTTSSTTQTSGTTSSTTQTSGATQTSSTASATETATTN